MNTTTLSTNVNELQKMVLSHRSELALLREELRMLRMMHFGSKSERIEDLESMGQMGLFANLEAEAPAVDPKETRVNGYQRKKPKRTAIPEHYPRKDIIHDVSPEDKMCSCGALKSCIGEDVSEQVDIIPAKIRVLRHRRLKYACKCCENIEGKDKTVVIAPRPVQILPKSLASASMLAFLVAAKYVDGMPLYRMEAHFKRLGFIISRKTMSDWMIKLGAKLQPLWQLLLREIKAAPWFGMDETPIQVHREKGRKNKTKSYMWIMRSCDPRPLVFFYYSPSRGQDVPKKLLKDYSGTVITDEWQAYKFLDSSALAGGSLIVHAGCWMHVRRKYVEVLTGSGAKTPKPGTITAIALNTIREMYRLERLAEEQDYAVEKRLAMRQEESRPLLEALKSKLEAVLLESTPTGKLGNAIKYTLRNWKQLTVFLENPLIHPDNRLPENSLRSFVIGRKNWLFSGSPAGAEASAMLYSLAITAKENGVNEYEYFRHLFEKLPLAQSEADLKALLPVATNFSQSPD